MLIKDCFNIYVFYFKNGIVVIELLTIFLFAILITRIGADKGRLLLFKCKISINIKLIMTKETYWSSRFYGNIMLLSISVEVLCTYKCRCMLYKPVFSTNLSSYF